MKTLEQIKKLKQKFAKEFGPAFKAVGNNLATGIGFDDNSGEYTIECRLTNSILKSALPAIFEGVKINIEVVGTVSIL